jgi:hypothetical protein
VSPTNIHVIICIISHVRHGFIGKCIELNSNVGEVGQIITDLNLPLSRPNNQDKKKYNSKRSINSVIYLLGFPL